MPKDSLPIVLVPGLNCSARLFEAQIPLLWRYGAVHVANHTREATIEDLAADILAHAPPKFALAGLSMGGHIAFEILRRAPQRVARLALINTSARSDTPDQMAVREQMASLIETKGHEAVLALGYPATVHASRKDDEDLRGIYFAMGRECGAEAVVRQLRAQIGRPDSRQGLAAIRVPTLVIAGDSDAVSPPEMAEEMAAGIEGARLVVIPACGHLAPIERPQIVNQALKTWVSAS